MSGLDTYDFDPGGPPWTARWVDEDPDMGDKEIDCGDGRVFRVLSPKIADYIVECVNASKKIALVNCGYTDQTKETKP